MRASEFAYAKINLFLDVTGKRADGFHEIKSIMQTITLADEIFIDVSGCDKTKLELFLTVSEELLAIGVNQTSFGSDEDNLAIKAARLYLERAGISAHVSIKLHKKIPVAAGLAGGSADAAATLRALNEIFKSFTEEELSTLGAELGSDVPFCILGGTALCTGRGEQTVRLSYTPELDIVVAIGKKKISTPNAYSALDEAYSNFDGTVKSPGDELLKSNGNGTDASRELREHLMPADGEESCIFNIFESSGVPELCEVDRIKNKLRSLGAAATLMSGSGPSVFGIFNTKTEAENAALELSKLGIFASTARTIRY